MAMDEKTLPASPRRHLRARRPRVRGRSIPTWPRSRSSQGTLTITFFEKQRLMLTPQPSPRQLWVAFRDRAWHFDWDDGAPAPGSTIAARGSTSSR